MRGLRNLWRRLSGAAEADLRRTLAEEHHILWIKLREDARRQEEQAAERDRVRHQAFLDALQAVVQAVQGPAQANIALAETIQQWLKLFHTAQTPHGWTHNDLSETLQEAEALKDMAERGFPTYAGPLDQYLFAAHTADRVPDLR